VDGGASYPVTAVCAIAQGWQWEPVSKAYLALVNTQVLAPNPHVRHALESNWAQCRGLTCTPFYCGKPHAVLKSHKITPAKAVNLALTLNVEILAIIVDNPIC
jgi:hypothetical protein